MYSTSQKWKETIYKNVQSVLNIYIDDELINPDYILEFKVGQTLFDEELTLGSISSKYIEFKIYKDKMPTNMNTVKVDYGILINHALTVAEVNAMLVGTLNGIQVKSLSANDSSFEMIPIGIFNIDDWTDNDDNTLTIKCIDNMSKFEFNYDGSKLEYPATLLTVLQDICSKAEVELGSTSFLNSNIQVVTYDNTVTAREYLSYISECAGGFACIGRDGKLYIRTIYQEEQEIPLELFGEYKWGDKYKISKVSYENGVESFKFGDDTCNNLWLNQDNMYIVEEDEVENIYNQLKGLEAYSFEGKTIIDPALDVGDKIIIDGKSVIYQGEADFQTRFISEISSKISIKQKQETTVKTTSQKVLNRRVQSSIDEINGKITQVVQETTANTEKLSKHEQTLDSITDTLSSVETTVEGTVKTVQVQYALSDSSTQAPESGWSNVAPEWQEGKYMWQKTVTIFMNDMQIESEATCIQGANGKDGVNGTNGKDGTDGKDGLGIEKLETQYYLSTSNKSCTGGSWKATQDKWTPEHYIWTRTKITWSDNSVTYSEPILAEGLNTANENANSANEGTKVVTTKMSEVEKTVESVTTTVTETTERLNNDYSTTEQTQSMIKSESDNINLSVTQKIDNIQVGGTNLIRNSAPYNMDNWVAFNSNVTVETDADINKNVLKMTLKKNQNNLSGVYNNTQEYLSLEKNEQYSVSLWLKGSTSMQVLVRHEGAPNQYFNITTEWKKYSYQFVCNEPKKNFIIYAVSANGGDILYAHSIKLEEGNKVTAWCPSPDDNVKGSEIISSINISKEDIKINSNKIELTANDVLNLLAGNTINLSGKEITMTSDHLNIDSNGKITITDEGTSTSYYFEIKKTNSNNNLKIGSYEISITNSLANSFIRAGEIGTSDNNDNQIYFNPNIMQFITASNITNLKASGIETPHITVNDGGNKNVTIEGNGYLGCDSLYVDSTGINCVGNIQAHSHIYCNNGVEPFSLAEKKRDIEKYNNKALDEVLKTDIYYYNYKDDAENIKRRVGAIIGTDYKCSKEIIGTEGKGIDLYSMISVAYKAIQEQQELIEKQNKTIENLISRVEKLEQKAGEA